MDNFKEEDDDLFDEPKDKKLFSAKLTIAVLVSLIIGGAIYFYNSYKDNQDNEMLLITVEPEEIKVQPIEPGGMVVENMDKTVYEAIEKKTDEDPKVEVILQPAEEPIDKKEILEEKKETEITDEVKLDNIQEQEPVVKDEPKPSKNNEEWDFGEEYIKPVAKESAVKPKFAKAEVAGARVQLAAFKSSKEAEAQWKYLSKKHKNLFKSYDHYIVSKNIPGKGIFYRLQIGPFENANQASAACKKIKDSGINCFTVK